MNDIIYANSKHIAGELDMAEQAMKRAEETLHQMWESGSFRMKKAEIERVTRYLKSIKSATSGMCAIIRNFEGIAPAQDAIVKEEVQ